MGARLYILDGDDDSPIRKAADSLMEKVCQEMDWPVEEAHSIIHGYEGQSFYVVLSKGGRVVCVNKIIVHGHYDLPVKKAFSEAVGVVDNDSCEVALTVTEKDFRKSKLAPLSFLGVMRVLRRERLKSVYALLEQHILDMYRKNYMLFDRLGEGGFYWGGHTWPCIMHLKESMQELRKKSLLRYMLFLASMF